MFILCNCTDPPKNSWNQNELISRRTKMYFTWRNMIRSMLWSIGSLHNRIKGHDFSFSRLTVILLCYGLVTVCRIVNCRYVHFSRSKMVWKKKLYFQIFCRFVFLNKFSIFWIRKNKYLKYLKLREISIAVAAVRPPCWTLSILPP